MAVNYTSKLTMVGHLEELRNRIITCIVTIAVVTIVAFFCTDRILPWLLIPSGGLHLRAFGLMDGFFLKIRIALYASLVLAFPVWAVQIYRYITPALQPHERKAIAPLLASALCLFLAGTGFGYYLLWGMIHLLTRLFPPQVEYLPSADNYISFVLFFLLITGFLFIFPTILLFLVHLDILSCSSLRRQRKIAYFILFATAEIVTPVADPIIAPLTVMIPLLILYEGTLLVATCIERKRIKCRL